MSKNDVFMYLHNIGCCKACCLRYIFVKTPDVYNNIDEFLKENNYLNESQILEDVATKKVKTNPCIICLGLLQEICIQETIDQVCANEKIKMYDSAVFTCAVSYPSCIQMREHSVLLDLDTQFPDFYLTETATPLNKTWKWIIKDKLAVKLNKKFENSDTCVYTINISMGYDLNDKELNCLTSMQPAFFQTRQEQRRKFRGELFSRKAVQQVLEMTPKAVFRDNATVPPSVASKQIHTANVDCIHQSIYIAGRYCKYSRELSQTPWILNGVKMMEFSVQQLIFEPLTKFLEIPEDKLKFASSGREDVDVRCLGLGRPFYMEYLDPKKTQITYTEFRELELQINQNKDIRVQDLQIVPREEICLVKDGEEKKTKKYEAICVCRDRAVVIEEIERLNSLAPLNLQQKTPIRVLHRRPLATRTRTIVAINASLIPDAEDNVFKLCVTTQAGTYVKEFVHGDLGRTIPSVSSLMDADVDIAELDVVAIDLDWPKPVVCPA